MIEQMFYLFEDRGVPIQITLDIGKNPTVHALFELDGETIHKTEDDTLLGALKLMELKLFGESYFG